jgi:hypothetical protein
MIVAKRALLKVLAEAGVLGAIAVVLRIAR